MKIAAVEAIPLRYPFRHGGPPSGWGGGAWTEMRTLLVRVETDAGLTGWGEAFGYNAIPATRAALETMVAPLAVGRDAGDIAPLMRDLQRELHLFGRYGVTCFALSGLDIALWDLAGKAAGEPLHRLARVPRNSVPTDAGVEQVEEVLDAAGDTARDSVPAYASLLKYGDPALVARLVGKALEEGYERVKLHESTVAPVAAARKAAGADTPIMLDVNCVWSPAEARRMAREMDEFGSPLARGAALAAGEFRRAGEPSDRGGHPGRRRRKRLHGVAIRCDVRSRRGRLCATQRHQGGRGERIPQGRGARRTGQCRARAAFSLFRAGLSGDLAVARGGLLGGGHRAFLRHPRR